MAKAKVYGSTGIKKQDKLLPKEFAEKPNSKLLSQAIRVYKDNLYPGLAKVKTRAEINKTKKKAYRQKGTGSARHGAKSAPIFVGGGVTHGPKGVKRILHLPFKMRKKALAIALSLKASKGKIVVLDGIEKITKTKDAAKLITKIAKDNEKFNKFTLALSDKNRQQTRAFRNLKNVGVVYYKNLNAYNVFFGGVLLIDAQVFGREKESSKKVNVKKVSTK